MPDNFDSYVSKSVDWRKTLRQNTNRTYFVIILFFLIYTGLGLLVDIVMVEGQYPDVPVDVIAYNLITFTITPIATLAMFGIAALSLFATFTMHDTLMLLGTEYHEVTPDEKSALAEKQLYNIVAEMVIAAGLRYMPKVYIIEADYMNAFASGYSEKSAMVAITRGLLAKLNRDEIQAVMAHELSHIRHLDIKLTLTASVLANLMIIIIDTLFYSAVSLNHRSEKSRQGLLYLILIVRYLLPIINVLLILYLSRTRELMADAGAVELMRTGQPLAQALVKIHDDHVQNHDVYAEAYQDTPHEQVRREAYLYDPAQAGIKDLVSINDLFSTHPSLQTRLDALGIRKRDQK